MKITPCTLLLSAALLAPAAAAQNLLSNADFEAGLTGWSSFGNAFAESANPPANVPLSGTQLCSMFGNFSGGFNVSGIFQSFPATDGDSFTIDAWSRQSSGDPLAGIGAPNDNWVVMKMAFFDAGGTEIGAAEGTILDGNSPTDTWIDNAPVTGTAPAGSASVQALILYLQPGNAGGAAKIDDVSFEGGTPPPPPPPPATGDILVNGDFEAGFSSWSTFGNAFAESANPPEIAPRSGTQLCKMFGNFSGGFNVSGIFQSFSATEGDSFTIDAWSRQWSGDPMAGVGAPNDNWVVMKMAFFDGGGTEIGGFEGTILDGTSPTDTWIDNAPVTGTAPAGTASVQALILYLQPAFAGGAAQIDDVSFERNCVGTLTIMGPATPNTNLDFDMNGEANALAYLLLGVAQGTTTLNFGPLGTLDIGLTGPYSPILMGVADTNGDASLVLSLPGSGLSNATFFVQGLTVSLGTTLNFCPTQVESFSITGY